MTEEKLNQLIEEAGGEIIFKDNYALTDWPNTGFCCYAPEEQFGEGTVCGFEEAKEFYLKHF